MQSHLKDLAWFCIGAGALFLVPALVMPARSRGGQREGRHGRAEARAGRARGDGWPDLRTCLTAVAIGLSLLAEQWHDHTARLLASIPVFAIVIWNVVSWLVSRARRRSADREPGRTDVSEPDFRRAGR